MPFLRALVSLLTLFGGHVLNRRLDRVVLIGALLMFLAVAYLMIPTVVFALGGTLPPWVGIALSSVPLLVALLAVGGAIVTFFDARTAPLPPLTVTMRVTGTALSIAGSFVLLALLLVSGGSPIRVPVIESDTSRVSSPPRSQSFHTAIHYGGNLESWDLPAPPRGAGRLRGRILLDGRGARGIGLYVLLNSKYRTENLSTNAEGTFEIELPPGTWYVNHVALDSWEGKPDRRELELFTPTESARMARNYDRSHYVGPNGLEVAVTDSPDAVAMTFELRETVTITWPLAPGDAAPPRDAEAVEAVANVQTSAITWLPVESAAEYEVQISRVTRQGTTTRFMPTVTRTVKATRLELAELPQNEATEEGPTEYSVQVYAFDAGNKLLTESGGFVGKHVFKLAGPKRLAREKPRNDHSDEYEINAMRLQRAAMLLNERKLEDARVLLADISGDAPAGRESALRGKLAALEGDCATARLLFHKATLEGGPDCVPPEDRKLCPAPAL